MRQRLNSVSSYGRQESRIVAFRPTDKQLKLINRMMVREGVGMAQAIRHLLDLAERSAD